MKKRNPAKKSSAKRNVAKAVRYDDGRENDAIGRSLRRFAGEGYVNNQERIDAIRRQQEEARKKAEEKQKGKGNGKGDGNNDGKNDESGKDEKKVAWDTDGDGKLSAKEKRVRNKYLGDADADGDGVLSDAERAAARGDYRKDLRQKEKKKEERQEEREKQQKEDKKSMNVDEFKKQRAARMDQISDDFNRQVEELIKKGYPEKDALVKAAYNRIENVGSVGSAELNKAQKVTNDLIDQYKAAKKYDKTEYGDIERKAQRAAEYDEVGFKDVEKMAKEADYEKTGFRDLEKKAGKLSDYDAADFSSEEYTTGDIRKRMSPYEKLVAERARQRLQRDYKEGRGQREAEAARAGAFGGSAAAVKEMADRRNYRDALKDLNAESLQRAFESGANLTTLADTSRARAEAAEEQSRQYGADLGMKGWEAQLGARSAEASEEARQAQQQLAQTSAVAGARQAAAAEEANQTQYALAGVEQLQKAREASATETARAKEAQLAGIAGQGASAAQLAGLSDQELKQYLAKTDAMETAGRREMDYQLDKQEYPLDLMQRNMNINTAAVGGGQISTQPNQSNPSGLEKAVGYAAALAPAVGAAVNAADTIGGWLGAAGAAGGMATPDGFKRSNQMASGGPVMGKPSLIINLANGGVVDLHNAMFRRK